MADPLVMLREYYINEKVIRESGDEIIFGEYSWHKSVKTNYINSKKSENREYYTLECLLFFLKNLELIHPDYCRRCAEENIPSVYRADRKKLLDYLNGDTETTSSIDKSMPPTPPSCQPSQYKRSHNNDDVDFATKKSRKQMTGQENYTFLKRKKK